MLDKRKRHTESFYWLMGAASLGLIIVFPLLKVAGFKISWILAGVISSLFLIIGILFIRAGDKIFNVWLEELRRRYEE